MDFLWFKPLVKLLKDKTPYQQIKTIIDCLNVYENQLHSELQKVTKAKAEIAMILVSDEYAEKVLKEKKDEQISN